MKADRRIQKVLEVLSYGRASPVDVETLAQSLNLSLSHVRHLFKREVGTSIGRFLRERRMEAAKRLLSGSFLSVKEVMAATGFADADETGFIRQFKKMFGVTPGQFRRRLGAGRRPSDLKEALRKGA